MIVNVYPIGQGITDHVDLLQFEDGIVGLSLLSSCIMNLKPLKEEGMLPLYFKFL
jgi:alkylated DNA repair dioxygenase AlkB